MKADTSGGVECAASDDGIEAVMQYSDDVCGILPQRCIA